MTPDYLPFGYVLAVWAVFIIWVAVRAIRKRKGK